MFFLPQCWVQENIECQYFTGTMDRHLSVANCKGCIGSALGRRRSLHTAIVRSATALPDLYIQCLYARNIRNIRNILSISIKMNSLIKFIGSCMTSMNTFWISIRSFLWRLVKLLWYEKLNFYSNFLKDNGILFKYIFIENKMIENDTEKLIWKSLWDKT